MTFGDGMGCGPARRPRQSPRRRPGLRPGMTAPCQELADGETEKGAFDKKVVFPKNADRKDKSRDGAPEGVGGSPSRPVRAARHGQKEISSAARRSIPLGIFEGHAAERPARPAPRPCVGARARAAIAARQWEETLRFRHRPSADPDCMKIAAHPACSPPPLRGRVGEGGRPRAWCVGLTPLPVPPPQGGREPWGKAHRPHFLPREQRVLPREQREAGVAPWHEKNGRDEPGHFGLCRCRERVRARVTWRVTWRVPRPRRPTEFPWR